MAHTPGKWSVSESRQSVHINGSRYSTPCFEVESESDACWIAQVQEHRGCVRTPAGLANARLIAAAPDLLEALKAAREELRLLRMKDTDVVYDPTLKVRIEAAIAKAEGR